MPHACRQDLRRSQQGCIVSVSATLTWTRFVQSFLFFLGAKSFKIFHYLIPPNFNRNTNFNRNCANCGSCAFLLGLEFVACTQLWPVLLCRDCWCHGRMIPLPFITSKKGKKRRFWHKTLPNFDYICKIMHTFNLCYWRQQSQFQL